MNEDCWLSVMNEDCWLDQFNGTDLPFWMSAIDGETVCSFLNYHLHQIPGTSTSRFHLLNRHPSGKLYLRLLTR